MKRVMKTAIVILSIFLLIIIMAAIQTSKNKEQTSIITEDGYTLSYQFNQVSDKGVILVHMMNRDKDDYKELASFLNKNGYSTITFDLRGHGDSQGNLKSFSDKDYQNMVLDIKAIKNFLVSKKVNKISIVGASIGANLGLNFAANSDIKRLVLLSPGENFHNVEINSALKNYQGAILFVAAKDDSYSYQTVQSAIKTFKGTNKFVSYDAGGHGTFMFATHPELKQTILDFIDNY